MVVNGKTWKLSIEQLASRREMLGRELDEVAKRRDELRSTQLRAAEVKELIKATELGQEQEELKASIKDIELILEGLHRNVERLSREVLTEETGEPQDALPGVDTSKPPKAPKAPKPSAAERTLQLPEHAGPGLTGEAEVHEGGPLAPEAPTVHRALPAARHADAIEAEVIEAEPTEGNLQRTILRELAGGNWLLTGELVTFAREALPGLHIEEEAVRACLAALEKGGRAERYKGSAELGESWRLLPEAPKAKPSKKGKATKASKPAPKKAPAKKAKGKGSKAAASEAAHLAAYEAEGRALVEEEPPPLQTPGDALAAWLLGRGNVGCHSITQAADFLGWDTAEAFGDVASLLRAVAVEVRGCFYHPTHAPQSSPHRAAVIRALEGATKRRSVRALATATGLGEYAIEDAIGELLGDGIVVRARRGGYQLKSKAESRPEPKASKPSKPSKKAPPAPPPCPPPPAQGHPQRVLRGWVYERIVHTGEVPLETLQAESPGYHQEYVEGTVALLLACDCLGASRGRLYAIELPEEKTLNQTVLDEVAGILRDAPLASAQIAKAMETPHAIVWDVLTELREQGRVALRGDAWHLTHGAAAEEEAA